MVRFFPTEQFKEITLNGPLQLRYAISNYGRLLSFSNEFSDGRIVKGTMIEGYRIFRYKVRVDGKLKHRHAFMYKLVAQHFLVQPSSEHTFVLHLDYAKSNDYVTNLKWATKEEMLAHQRKSPYVIRAKENRLNGQTLMKDGAKLTTTKVMMLKKQLANPNRKTRIKMLAKQFGISEMQVYRIRSGENWSQIKID